MGQARCDYGVCSSTLCCYHISQIIFTEGADSVRLDRGDFGGQITLPLQWPNHCRKARLGVHLIIIIDDQ